MLNEIKGVEANPTGEKSSLDGGAYNRIQLSGVLMGKNLAHLILASAGKQLGELISGEVLELIHNQRQTRPLLLRRIGVGEYR